MDLDPKTQNSIPKQAGDQMKYAVLFGKTATGYSAHVPDLPGCVAAGSTLAETAALMREAILMHLARMREDGEPVPEPRTIAEYIVGPDPRPPRHTPAALITLLFWRLRLS